MDFRSAFVGAILSIVAMQTAKAEPMYARGVGTTTCGRFATLYRDNPEHVEMAYFSWAQGYMSGLNRWMYSENKTFKDQNASTTDVQLSFIRKYCNEHPLANYSTATTELFRSLPEVKR